MTAPLRLGIAGLGTVGAGLIRLLSDNREHLTIALGREIVVTAVSARDRSKPRDCDLSKAVWYDDPVALAQSPDIDIFVELIGGEEGAARAAVEAALKAGRHVVTANKALLARHGVALAGLAEQNDCALDFEAAVAGGIPIIKTLRESLLGNRIDRIYGILNGTCNFILTKMQAEGRPFAEVLAEAQKLGYAEADPTFDVGGFDAAHKLAILTSLAFGTQVAFDEIHVEGIEHISEADITAADELGYRIKLLGVALRTASGIEARVHPTMVPKHSAIAEVSGVTNCVAVDGDRVGTLLLVGPGAGSEATASAVASDIIDIARGGGVPPLIVPVAHLKPHRRAKIGEHQGAYYVRLSVFDKPGAMAAIAKRMGDRGVSLESIVQRRAKSALPGASGRGEPGAPATVTLITHETTEEAIRGALDAIESDGNVSEKPQMIRIETL
ncbi:MAG: homoserine dehydrogenase [Hyphomicrobiaceae bacterium]|nr:homoserine dehydrogenase [Hyphomicrobiaceae bacterium]